MKKIKYLLFLTLLIPFMPIKAATGVIDIYASNKTLTVGDTTTITIYCKSSSPIGACEYSLNYDKSKLKLTSGDIANLDVAPNASTKQMKKTFQLKAIATGTSTVSVKSYAIRDFNTEKEITTTVDPVTIKNVNTVKQEPTTTPPKTYSTNNNLKSLSIDGQTLSPKFSKTTTNYQVKVDESIEKIKINAQTEDNRASLKGTGTFDISNGANKFQVIVTSEKGTKKTYTITVTSEDKNPITKTINEKEYTIIKRKTLLKKPDNSYEEKEVIIQDQKIPALYSNTTKQTLIGLKDKEGKISLFEYHEEDESVTPYKTITCNSLTFLLKTPTTTIGKKTTVMIGEEEITMYQTKNSSYPLFYATNTETGKTNWYSYDAEENTVQKYQENQDNSQKEETKRVILILAGTTAFFAIAFFITLGNKNTKPKNQKPKEKKNQTTKKKDQKKESVEKLLEDW